MHRSFPGRLGPSVTPSPNILFGLHCVLKLSGISSQQFYIERFHTQVWVLGFLLGRILKDWVALDLHANTGLVLCGSCCLLRVLSMSAQPLPPSPSMSGPHRPRQPRPWTQISGSHTPSGHRRFPLTPTGCEHLRHPRASSGLRSFSLEEGWMALSSG